MHRDFRTTALCIELENRLAGFNPRTVLQRGYSITTNKKTGLLIKSPADVQIADDIITELADENLVESQVTKKYKVHGTPKDSIS